LQLFDSFLIILALELLFSRYNTFVTPQVFQMTAEGTVGAPSCLLINQM
jgi:hypothetical protein